MSIPRLLAGKRKVLMARLLANGLGQAGTAFAIAWLLRSTLHAFRTSPGDPPRVALAGLAVSGLILFVLRTLERTDAEELGQDYAMRVRLRLFERVSALPLRRERRERFGLTMARMISDLSALRNWVSIGIARMVVATVSLVGILGVLVSFDPLAGAVTSGVVAVCIGVAALLTPRLREHVREARRWRGRLAGNVGEKVFAFGTVRHFGRTKRERRRVRLQSRRLTGAAVRRMRVSGAIRALPSAAFPIIVAVLLVAMGMTGHSSQRHTSTLAVTMLLLSMVVHSLRDLARAWDYRVSFEVARQRIDQLLTGPRLREARRAAELPGEGGVTVELRDARVGSVLTEVSATARSGEKILLTGDSGSGKSTLLGLLARLFDPDGGVILLDGIPLTKLSLDSVHAAVQLVSPELPLLRGSVAENIGYGLDEEAPELIAEAADLCGLDAFVELLPMGLQTRIGEKGQELPAALRSRISLARALVVTPRLLLVDDPLLTVDPGSRRALSRAVQVLDATVFVVGREGVPGFDEDRTWQLAGGQLSESVPPARSHADSPEAAPSPPAGSLSRPTGAP
ncbi:MAG: ATP-binding cassette domain-containing protein [Myxococcota bacterium]